MIPGYLLDDVLGAGKVSGDEVNYDCPFCVTRGKTPDDEGKLWVNLKKELFVCFRCESKGTVQWLLQSLGVDYREDAVPVDDESWRAVLEYVYDDAPAPDTGEVETRDAEIPYVDYTSDLVQRGCAPVRPGTPVYQYLTETRGLRPDWINYYVMLEGRGLYTDRVVVPAFAEDSRIEFFVARSIRKSPTWLDGSPAPKYLNPKGGGRKYSVWHLRRAIEYLEAGSGRTPLVITEGVFSAIAVGPYAVATYGKLVTPTQIGLLYRFARDREILVMLDADAHAQTLHLASRLHELGMRVSMAFLPEGDPDDMNRAAVLDAIDRRHPFDESVIMTLQLEGVIQCRQLADPIAESKPLTEVFDSWIASSKMG